MSIDEKQINFIGMLGSYGNRCANISIENADLLIAVGSRLDTRQTGANYKQFLNKGNIIKVDIDENELNSHRITNRLTINIDINIFIQELLSVSPKLEIKESWISYIKNLHDKYNQDREVERFVENKAPYRLFQKLNEISNADDIFVADIGQNQMWCAQTIKIRNNQNFFTSGGHAPMGFSIPFSIGLSFRNRANRIFSICGDGGFHISTQSLMLISQYNLPIKVIVINNQSLGMITQFQGLYFENNMIGTTEKKGYLVPNIKALAKAYCLDYFSLTIEDLENDELLDKITNNKKGCIIEYHTEGLTSVSPKLEYNSAIYNPSPKLESIELNNALNFENYDL